MVAFTHPRKRKAEVQKPRPDALTELRRPFEAKPRLTHDEAGAMFKAASLEAFAPAA